MLVGREGASARSSRSPALRFRASVPWQAKQWSDRIGRMSRLKASGAEEVDSAAGAVPTLRKAPIQRRIHPGMAEQCKDVEPMGDSFPAVGT